MRYLWIVFVWAVCVTAHGAELAKMPADGLAIALADARTNPLARETLYFFNIHGAIGGPEEFAALSYTCNTVLATSTDPELLAEPCDPDGYVVKVNLLRACPDPKQRARIRLILETLGPRNFYFHSIDPEFITAADGISVPVDVAAKHAITLEVPPFVLNGKTFTRRQFAKFIPAAHLAGLTGSDLTAYYELAARCNSINPIMSLGQATSVYLRSTNGGLYIELAGIPATEKEFDDLSGANFAEAAKRRSDERSALWQRRLNKKPAIIEWAASLNVKGTRAGMPAIKTRDFARRQSGAAVHPVHNILGNKAIATEAFGPKPNGHWFFGLYDLANGNRLATVAPAKVAIDTDIDDEIELAHSCIRCHGPHDMIQPFSNHLADMTETPVKVDGWELLPLGERMRRLGIIADKSQPGSLEEALERAAGLYSGDPQEMQWMARYAHTQATIRSTGGVFGLDPVSKACERVALQFARYEYYKIDASQACFELGIKAKDEAEAKAILTTVSINGFPETYGFSPETPALWSILTAKDEYGLPKRENFEQEYAVLMLRVTNALRTGVLNKYFVKPPEKAAPLPAKFQVPEKKVG